MAFFILLGVGSFALILFGYCFYSFVKVIENTKIKLLIGGIPAVIGIILRVMAINTPALDRKHTDIITPEAVHLDNLSFIYTMSSGILIPFGIILFLLLLLTLPPKNMDE